MRRSRTLLYLSVLLAISGTGFASETDHREFEATLHVPYVADAASRSDHSEARTFTLSFAYPHVEKVQDVAWKVEMIDASGRVVQSWYGVDRLAKEAITVKIKWSRLSERAVADGVYQVRMQAVSKDGGGRAAAVLSDDAIDKLLAAGGDELVEQAWEMAVGAPATQNMPKFNAMKTSKSSTAGTVNALAAPAPASLPYTVYFGNLHSQTNHSDGGGNLASCTGAQNPQSAALGPTDAYTYAMNKGLDILMASEHNHMYDGSDNTNTSADPATAKALYQSGLSAAASFNAAHPSFLAVYGMEWGVISNGGHMNIFNSNELLEWEYNASNQLIGDTFTAKSDYGALYTLMRSRGWVGQFNHPSTSGQFLVGGTAFGYTADGDQAMALCEVLNTSAFSVNTSETETSRSTYEGACNKALEAGFHVAFSSDQDNHCANWGASYTNRTGVLIPTGTALSTTSFIDAIKARRVFATMDKTSQLVLTGNGHIMGERFANSGTLNLVANFASSSGKTVSSVVIYEGVPGRNGTVTQLATTANTTITPSNGEHFYYAKLTQNDGNILWSAPLWVSQGAASGDTTAPSVSASESGSSGTITLSATASDNVGVSKVEFYIDGALKGTDTSAPYSMSLSSTTLSNGSHALTAKAYDAAGNSTVSTAVNFNVSNTTAQQLIVNGGFESGSGSWTATSGVITSDSGEAAHGGSWKAWLDGYGAAHTDSLYQTVTIPSTATTATLSFWLLVDSAETTTTNAYDTLKVQVRNSSNTVLTTLATYSNLNKGTSYQQKSFDVSAYKGQTVRIYFEGVEGSTVATSFVIDDVSLNAQ